MDNMTGGDPYAVDKAMDMLFYKSKKEIIKLYNDDLKELKKQLADLQKYKMGFYKMIKDFRLLGEYQPDKLKILNELRQHFLGGDDGKG